MIFRRVEEIQMRYSANSGRPMTFWHVTVGWVIKNYLATAARGSMSKQT